jgi:hypothetical protein
MSWLRLTCVASKHPAAFRHVEADAGREYRTLSYSVPAACEHAQKKFWLKLIP